VALHFRRGSDYWISRKVGGSATPVARTGRTLEIGVRGVTEERKQLSVVTDGSEGVYRPTIVLGSPTTASEEGRHTMRAILTLQMSRT
jgi:hypothetical protein